MSFNVAPVPAMPASAAVHRCDGAGRLGWGEVVESCDAAVVVDRGPVSWVVVGAVSGGRAVDEITVWDDDGCGDCRATPDETSLAGVDDGPTDVDGTEP